MKRVVGIALVALAVTTAAAAQEKPKAGPPVSSAPTAATLELALPADVKTALADLQMQGGGYVRSIAVLQKELDGVNAEIGRLVQRIQQAYPGYDLTPALTLVKKPEPTKAPEKKDSPQ